MVSIRSTADATFVEWEWREEAWGGWEEGSGWMSALIPLRAELMRGDLSALYLGWLSGIERAIDCEDLDPDAPTPSPPPGFGDLSAAGHALMDFLQLDPALVSLAAEGSPPAALDPDWDDLAAALAELSEDESVTTLSAGELLERSRTRAEELARAEAARRTAEAARLRAAELDALEGREEATWDEVAERIDEKQARSYDRAVGLLVDLRDLAIRQGEEDAFRSRLRALLSRFSTHPALMKRLKKANLGPEP